MPFEPIVQIVLGSIYTSIRSCQTVHLPINSIVEALLHVRFVVEVWHLPTIFLVVVVMSISGVMTRRYTFRIRCWCSVIEIHLRTILVGRRSEQLLRFLPSVGTVRASSKNSSCLGYEEILSTYRAQIIQIRRTIKMIKITEAAIPPAMYANSDFSAQCFPVKLPMHLQEGIP